MSHRVTTFLVCDRCADTLVVHDLVTLPYKWSKLHCQLSDLPDLVKHLCPGCSASFEAWVNVLRAQQTKQRAQDALDKADPCTQSEHRQIFTRHLER